MDASHMRDFSINRENKIVWGLENGSERSKINTAKMASILIENVKKCTRIMEIIMFMITN